MTDQELKKDLAEHKIFSAWQFIANTRANINVAEYCFKTFNAVVKRMSDEAHKSGAEIIDKIEKHGKDVFDKNPDFMIDIAEHKVDGFFLAQKLIRDFYQSLRNSFDGMGQTANAGLLANKGLAIDNADFSKAKRELKSQEFPKTATWFEKISQDDRFKYINDVCNRTKHTAFISNQISIGLFGCQNILNMGPFVKNGKQHEKTDLKRRLEESLDYTIDSFNSFLSVFAEEYVKDIHVQGRYNTGIKVFQQYIKDDKKEAFSIPYLISDCSFAGMPEKIYVMLLSNKGDKIEAVNSPFPSILITSDDNYKTAIGRYTADPTDKVGIDSIVKYRAYNKDKSISDPNLAMINVIEDNTGKLYRINNFFGLETNSDDEDFVKTVGIPFK